MSQRIFSASCGPSNKDNEKRYCTRLKRTKRDDIKRGLRLSLHTKYILRRGNLGTVNAMNVPVTSSQLRLAKLMMFFVRLSRIPILSKIGERKYL